MCEPIRWALNFGTALLLGVAAFVFAKDLSTQVPFDDACLDFRKLAFELASKAFAAGILAAVCGIGGGMVMGPILVQLNVPPPVSAATTATTLLVLSSSTGLV